MVVLMILLVMVLLMMMVIEVINSIQLILVVVKVILLSYNGGILFIEFLHNISRDNTFIRSSIDKHTTVLVFLYELSVIEKYSNIM